ncbi:MAG: four-helix bundle copper-binding protein [Chloroflexota bacterium]|nr:four-helix bundle copper-binding protein [Chloroflexota bacterium]
MTQDSTSNTGPNQQMQDCIQDCLNCHTACIRTAAQCLQAGGDHAKSDHIQNLLDAAEMSLTTAHFLMRNSALYGYACQACAKVAEHCGNECEQMGDTDCANACRNCSYSCSQMAKMVAYGNS